jgi:hypothetical protein
MGTNLTRTYNHIARHQGSGVLSTAREQKHLLHHRSYCRYRDRPQSAPRVLAQGPSRHVLIQDLSQFLARTMERSFV